MILRSFRQQQHHYRDVDDVDDDDDSDDSDDVDWWRRPCCWGSSTLCDSFALWAEESSRKNSFGLLLPVILLALVLCVE